MLSESNLLLHSPLPCLAEWLKVCVSVIARGFFPEAISLSHTYFATHLWRGEWLTGCVNEVDQVEGISGILTAFELAMVVTVDK